MMLMTYVDIYVCMYMCMCVYVYVCMYMSGYEHYAIMSDLHPHQQVYYTFGSPHEDFSPEYNFTMLPRVAPTQRTRYITHIILIALIALIILITLITLNDARLLLTADVGANEPDGSWTHW